MGIKGQEKGRSLCSKFTRVDERHLGGHSHSGDAQGVDISLCTLSLQEFFAGKGVASREAEIFFFYHKDTNCRSRNKENSEKTKIKF